MLLRFATTEPTYHLLHDSCPILKQLLEIFTYIMKFMHCTLLFLLKMEFVGFFSPLSLMLWYNFKEKRKNIAKCSHFSSPHYLTGSSSATLRQKQNTYDCPHFLHEKTEVLRRSGCCRVAGGPVLGIGLHIRST